MKEKVTWEEVKDLNIKQLQTFIDLTNLAYSLASDVIEDHEEVYEINPEVSTNDTTIEWHWELPHGGWVVSIFNLETREMKAESTNEDCE